MFASVPRAAKRATQTGELQRTRSRIPLSRARRSVLPTRALLRPAALQWVDQCGAACHTPCIPFVLPFPLLLVDG